MLKCPRCNRIKWPRHQCAVVRHSLPTVRYMGPVGGNDYVADSPVFVPVEVPVYNAPAYEAPAYEAATFAGFEGGDTGGGGSSGSWDGGSSDSSCDSSSSDSGSCDSGSGS